MRTLYRRAVLLTCVLLLTAGCRTPATQIQLFIDTDAPVERAVTLEVFSFNGSVAPMDLLSRANSMLMSSLRLVRMNNATDTFTAGGSIGVVPPSDRASNTVTLWLRATVAATGSSPAVLVDRAARVTFVRGRSGTARVFLPLRCGDLSLGCNSVAPEACTVSVRCREQDATCGDFGECVQPQIPVVIGGADGGMIDDIVSVPLDATTGRVDVTVEAGVPVGISPRPITPLSLGDASLRRPTLRWELPAGTDGAQVDLCRDRACTMVIESVRAMGTSVRPMMALPASSVVFWRLRATSGMATGTTFSPTWLFHVPAIDNAGNIDTSSNAHLDVNGDGFDDVVVGASSADPGGRINAGSASVFHGSPGGIPMAPASVVEGVEANDEFGVSVASAGDVNGDGFGDLVIGALQASPGRRRNAGTASVFHGSPDGIPLAPTRVLEGIMQGNHFGVSVSSAGDVNGDGFGDLVIGAHGADPVGTESGAASVFHGSLGGIAISPARVLEGLAGDDVFGSAVASAGDVNGDGFGDLVIGAQYADPGGRALAGTASVFHGSPDGIPMAPARVLEGVATDDRFSCSVASAGDVNGDGFGDIVIGAHNADPGGRINAGSASVFHGSPGGIPQAPARVLEGLGAGDWFGVSVASAGDVNGDGFGDLATGARYASPGGRFNGGTASVFHGSLGGVAISPARVLEGLAANEGFGTSVTSAGDVNGDGFDELVVGAPSASPMSRLGAGTARVFLGSMNGISMAPASVLEGVAASDSFGVSVANGVDVHRDVSGDDVCNGRVRCVSDLSATESQSVSRRRTQACVKVSVHSKGLRTPILGGNLSAKTDMSILHLVRNLSESSLA